LLLLGCRGGDSLCPAPSVRVDPRDIPQGSNETRVSVTVSNPDPDNGREVLTELYADSGTFADPRALETLYACAHDQTGEVEICVDAIYGPPSDSESPSAGEPIASAVEYLRRSHVFIVLPEDCHDTACTKVVCPSDKNECPVISEFTVQPEVIMADQSATVRVVAEDPDDNPAPLVTNWHATAGIFGDRHASETTYTCDLAVGGPVEICVEASDGDGSCDVIECVTATCPGPQPDNICPVIRSLTSTPQVIPPDERQSIVEVDAFDPDAVNPLPLLTALSASTGTFYDKNASETVYSCGAPGPAEICVDASDGGRECDQERCITIQCPSTVPDNLCPKLYVLNAVPSNLIPEGQSSTEIQVRAQDNDRQPLPLMTTLYALWGTFDDVHASDTIYRCERPGGIEICADATDGACFKTMCMDVVCPDDL
jgi:hypothetical protein